eukprot:Skav201016  [mRNA]  locus=scaffold991:383861:391384:- [translate_table: standard]
MQKQKQQQEETKWNNFPEQTDQGGLERPNHGAAARIATMSNATPIGQLASDAGLASQEALRGAEAAILDSLEARAMSRVGWGAWERLGTAAAARGWQLQPRVVSCAALALDGWALRAGAPRQERLNHKINRSFDFEDKTLEKYRNRHPGGAGERVEPVGLLVHPDLPWLGASPDGLSWSEADEAPTLIEIKSCRSLLGKKSPAWHQVQGAMAIASGAFQCNVTRCKIIDPVETYNICFDEVWWEKFLQRLKAFYFGLFLPMAARRILKTLGRRDET